ncbi:MAG: purine-nucleoside phosphorylase [Oscillospiraceae bacterium]|nr:purine-nucleoside phosphorylase [Oscillospiraceae bacterium]
MQTPSACMDTEAEQLAKVVLFPGDPLRTKALAERYFENPQCFNHIRGMFGYTGLYRGRRVSVMGSGMGVPSATLYAHDLYTYFGVESIIRIGTAGGLRADVRMRDLVLAMTASTSSNFSAQFSFPGLLAPVADWSLLRTAAARAEAGGLSYHVGSIFTGDAFYDASPNVNEKCRDFGMLAVDMETAGIYWEAMSCKKRALSILTVANHIFTGEELPAQERQEALREMMETALDTAWEFAE